MSAIQAGISIDVNTGGAEAKLARLGAALDGFASKGKSAGAANDNIAGTLDRIRKSADGAASSGSKVGAVLEEIRGRAAGGVPAVGNLVSKLGAIGPQGAIIATVAVAIAAVGVAAVKAAAQVEVWKANLLTMTKSSQAADAAYRGLVQFAASTPFSLEQSVQGFTKLRALGLATSTDIMTSYGNTAAAMGKNMSQMIEAVADATTGEFERLKEFGIKAKTEGNKVAFTFQGVTTTVGKNATEIQKYIVGIGKTNFGGAMARQMATASGAFANLQDQIFNTLAAMGDGALNQTIGKITNAITAGLGAVTPLLSGIMDVIGGILSAVTDVASGLLSMFTGGEQGAANFKTGLDSLAVAFAFIGEGIQIVGQTVGSVFGFIGNVIGTVIGAIQSGFGSLFNWLVPTTGAAGQSMGESFVGILRAASYVAGQLPNIFAVALAELKAMFAQAGAAMAASLTGDFSKWGNVDLSFGRTRKVVGTVMSGAGRIQGDQRGNRAWIDNAAGRNSGGNINYGAMGADKPAAAKGSKSKGESEAEKRARQEKEFWDTLKGQVETAKLLPLEAENYAKQLELQKILGRDLNATEKDRLNTEMQKLRSAQFLTEALDTHNKKARELDQQQELFAKTLKGMTEEQAAVEQEVYKFRNEALAKGVDLQSEAYRISEAQVRSDAARGAELEKNNKLLSQGKDLFAKYTKSGQLGAISKKYDDERSAASTAYANGNGKYSEDDYRKVLKRINKEEALEKQEIDDKLRAVALEKWSGVINSLGDVFGGIFSKIASQFDKLAGSLKGESGIGGLMKKMGLGDAFKGKLSDMFGKNSGLMKGLSGTFNKLFGKNGTAIKGLGSVIGQMGAGAQVGQTIAGFGKMISSKFSTTGSMIGGAIGQFAGPLGAIAGSILGGIVGGLFKKAKWGTASVINGKVTTKGNDKKSKEYSTSAGNSIVSGLESIAEQLGGAADGDYAVSIGQYKGKWRVSRTGRTGKLKGGKGRSDIKDFGKNGAEEALAYAIQDAIRDGAITGLRATTQAIISVKGDLEAQLTKALKFEGVFRELEQRTNPVASAVKTIANEFKSLTKIFDEAGATAEEYAQMEQLKQLKLKDILEEQTSSFRNILDTLNGEAGGFSSMSQLNSNLAKMGQFRADLAAGKTVDQEKFAALMDSIISGTNDIYGANSSAGQSILSDVRSLTEQAMANVTSEFNKGVAAMDTTTAIQKQTDAYVAQQQVANGWLKQIAEKLEVMKNYQGNIWGLPVAMQQAGNVNGAVTMAY